MRCQHEDPGRLDQVAEPLGPPLPELGVAHREPLVHDHDVGAEARHDRERQPHQHAGRVGPHRHRQVITQTAELGDLRGEPGDLLPRNALDQPADQDVFVAGGVAFDPHRWIDEARYRPAANHAAPRGRIHASHHLQQRRLAGPVVPHHTESVAGREGERHLAERLHHRHPGVATDPAPRGRGSERRLQRGGADSEDRKLDRHVFEHQFGHGDQIQ